MMENIVTHLVFPDSDEEMLISSNFPDDNRLGKKVRFSESFGEYVASRVHEADREMLLDAVNLKDIKKSLPNIGDDLRINYRDITGGSPLWYIMRVVRQSEDEFLYGYRECDMETTNRMIYEKAMNDYFALYLVDIDSGYLKIIKDSPFFPKGEAGEMVPYSEAILQFANALDGEASKFFVALSDIEFVKNTLKKEDKKTYSYQSSLAGGNRWVTLTSYVIRRDKSGDAAAFTLAFSLTDSLEVRNLELKKKLHLHNEIFDIVGTAFLLLNFVNLNENRFMIVKNYEDETYKRIVDETKPYTDSISGWIEEMVHPEDRDKIRRVSDIDFLKDKFKQIGSISEIVRVKSGDEYRYFEVCFARTDSYTSTSEVVVYCVDRNDDTIEKIRQKNEIEVIVAQRTSALKEANTALNLLSDRVLEFIGDLVESRSEESGQHIRRVKGYTRILAEKVMENLPEYGLTEDAVKMISHASALHDIGKIAIPDGVLLKKGRLTSEEFEIMKSHSERGADIVMKMEDIWDNSYISLARDICYFHHEKWDGKGYPKGLKGDEIPISAQIVSVADIYDALTTERCYKDAFPKDVAFNMILNGECGAFSDKLIRCFKLSRKEFEEYSADSVEIVNEETFSYADETDYQIPEHVKSREFIKDTLPLITRITGNMPIACFVYFAKDDGELIFANDNMYSLFGCENRDEFERYTGNTFKGMVYPDDYDEVQDSIEFQMAGNDKKLSHTVFRIVTKDGRVRKTDDYAHLISSDDMGDLFFASLIDITDYGYGNTPGIEESVEKTFVNLRVLLVDDDDMSRDIASELLNSEGAVVYEARNGLEAIEIIKKNDVFDMILMDIQMPVMDGVEATRKIRSLPIREYTEVPLIALTADDDEEIRKMCIKAGADDFLKKPVNVKEISNKYIMCMKKRTQIMQSRVRESLLLANTDALTKVKNATAYAEKLGELNSQIANGIKVEFAVVMCDVNELKTENDKFGHESGDIYIKNCCRIISTSFKHSPVYRIGGDEFVVIVQGDDLENCDILFDVMMKNVAIASKYATASTGRASFAAGLAEYDFREDMTASDTVKRADEKMYENKIATKNTI